MNAELRALRADEHDAVLDLWGKVFSDDDSSYFDHYFTADPDYQDEDCRVAVVDGEMAAAVLVCRRRMEWRGRQILCGAIANVATRESYRRQGRSRDLLRQAIERMEAEHFDFSMLFTGRYGHYGALGWTQVETPRLTVKLPQRLSLPAAPIRQMVADSLPEEVQALYEAAPHRPLHMIRRPEYFRGWTGWFWSQHGESGGKTILLAGPEGRATGYAVYVPRRAPREPCLHELQAVDRESEADLLRAAAQLALEGDADGLELGFVPQFGGEETAALIGEVSRELRPHMMLRSIALPADEMAAVADSYATGAAVFWSGDDF